MFDIQWNTEPCYEQAGVFPKAQILSELIKWKEAWHCDSNTGYYACTQDNAKNLQGQKHWYKTIKLFPL